MGSGKQDTRRSRRDHATQGNNNSEDSSSTMDFDQTNQEDQDDRRRNTSSEDEGDEVDQCQLATNGHPVDPSIASLVSHASQVIGSPGADGTAFALAATNAPSPAEALNLLAASSAIANMGALRASSHASYALAESDLASEGLRNSDHTYDNRFKRQEEMFRLRDIEVQKLQIRVTLLEGLLSRFLSMMQNGNIDVVEIGQMLQNFRI